jgi:starch phosphorylase
MAHEDTLRWFEWFKVQPRYIEFQKQPIAYFCAEYALESHIPTYAGGLGVLAGDTVHEAGDRGMPFVGIGLYYHEGYVCQTQRQEDHCIETCDVKTPQSVGLEPVVDERGEVIKIDIPIADSTIKAVAWKWVYKSATVFLLDTKLPENAPSDQKISSRLYIGDKELRLKQEIVLGIGGRRLLDRLEIHPSVYHMNEGHSAFLAYGLIRYHMDKRQIGFDEAKQFARRRIVFTNHTLVAAGNEIYSNDLVSLMLSGYAKEIGIPASKLVELGLVQESSSFSMTMLSMRMAGIINAVSKLHAKKAKDIWADHPMVGLTNGIHVPRWDGVENHVSQPGQFWVHHMNKKRELLEYIREQTSNDWSEDSLLVGWARRTASYKRPLAAFADIERVKKIANSSPVPVRFVFAGKPHPKDDEGNKILAELMRTCEEELKGVAVYLQDYTTETSKKMITGTDVWLNTPIVGFEACGTSGMKATLNGSLPVSTRDGWMDEIEMYGIGWYLDNDRVSQDLYDKLEKEIIPYFIQRNNDGVPVEWEQNMRNGRELIQNEFSASRMFKEYVGSLYS